MDKLILRFVLFFVKTFLKKDVDFERLKIITETKLLMDRRRVRVTMKQRSNKEPKNQLLMTQIVYAVFGLMIGFLIFKFNDNIRISMIFLHSYMLFMMAMTLITDFSSVMLDTADNQIILPRPVTSKTIFVARLVHILVYLLQFTVALAAFPIIFTFIVFGPLVGFATIGTLLLTVAFAVFLTYLLYALILRFSSEEKIKDIISWFQIFMTVFFAVGYQVLPRLINFDALKATIDIHWYSYLLPPVWMALTLEGISTLHFDGIHLIMLALTIVAPIITFWIMIKFLAPSFARKLSGMGSGSSNDKPQVAGVINKRSLSEKLSSVFAGSKTEQAGFELTWKMTSRDKTFKIQFYPSLAYLVVFAFVFVFKSGKDISVIWHTLSDTKLFLWFVYLPMFSISSAIMLIAYNENFAASWIYLASPLQKPGSLISGALKSLLIKFFTPIFLILFGFSFYIWGVAVIDDFILGFFNNVIIFLLMAHLRDSYLPFSTQPNPKQNAGKFVQMILQLVIIAVVVGLHYLALQLSWTVPVLIPVSMAGCYFLFRLIQNYSWQKIAS
jgi:ABC-2 type transport system permease protein